MCSEYEGNLGIKTWRVVIRERFGEGISKICASIRTILNLRMDGLILLAYIK